MLDEMSIALLNVAADCAMPPGDGTTGVNNPWGEQLGQPHRVDGVGLASGHVFDGSSR